MKRTILTVAAIALIACGVVGTTVAWLSDTTDPVTNIFTYGNIDITLEETDDGDGDLLENTYDIKAGTPITKDPIVSVLPGSEDAWVFVKLEKSPDFDTFLQFTVAGDWTALEGYAGVYCLEYTKSEAEFSRFVLENNTVDVKPEVTREMLNALETSPTLKVKAYAVQRDAELDAIDAPEKAWEIVLAEAENN